MLWHLVAGVPGLLGVGLRYVVAKSLCARLGDNVYFGPHIEIRGWDKLAIGSNVSIHRGCYIDALGGVEIGSNVSIAHQSSLLTFEHTWADESLPIRDNPLITKPVRIDEDVWIGCGVRVLAGVHIKTRTVIAAGAIVNRSFAGCQLLGGVPARPIKKLGSANVEQP